MAEIIGSEAAKICLEKLFSETSKRLGYAWGIKPRIDHLATRKQILESFLQNPHRAHSNSNALRSLFEEHSDFLLELSCFLDMRKTMAMQSPSTSRNRFKKVLCFLSSSPSTIIRDLRDGQKVKSFTEKLESLVNSLILAMSFETVSPGQSQEVCIGMGPFTSEEIIGRDEDRDSIVNMLLEPSRGHQTFSVFSVVGIGGSGKTTLVQYVFHDERVAGHFDVRLWVDVTPCLAVKNISMLEFAPDGSELLRESVQLQYQFKSYISGKRYLLVLDNICDHKPNLNLHWPEWRKMLGFGGPGSCVLTTTRSAQVAKEIGTVELYVLSDLGIDDCWRLFERIAFAQGQKQGLEDIGKEIVEKCPHVPLVIHSVALHLQGKDAIGDWEEFSHMLGSVSYLEKVPRVMHTLKLMYNDLDPRLKHCFRYFSLFSKAKIFQEPELICLWIALGYVERPPKEHSLVESARKYVLGLKEKGFLRHRVIHEGWRWYQLHGVFHDLALSVAGSKYKRVDSDCYEFDESIQHVSFSGKVELSGDFPSSLQLKKKDQVQSLLFFRSYGSPKSKLKLKGLSKFKSLKVLRLTRAGLEEVPRTIGELSHLGYLDLSGNSLIRKLPYSITKLAKLVFLNLQCCSGLEELPTDLNKLRKLIYLNLGNCVNLRKLPKTIGKLVELRTLDLQGCMALQELPAGLNELQNLTYLNLRSCVNLRKLPRDISKMTNLASLSLEYCSELQELPRDLSRQVKLRELRLDGCWKLKHVPSGMGSLTDLRSLGLFVAKGVSSSLTNESGNGEVGRPADLNLLNNLEGYLTIVVDGSWSSESEAREANLQEKKKLERLRIDFKGGSNKDHEIMLEGFRPPCNLRELHIRGYRGERPPRWIGDGICNFSKLETIVISDCRNLEDIGSSWSDRCVKRMVRDERPADFLW